MKLVARLDTAKLDDLIKQAPEKARKIVARTAFAVQGKAAVLTPKDTHALENSITAKQVGPFTYWVHDGVEYGIYQEFGTSRMAAHPFMVPAVESVREQFEREIAEAVQP